jgi:hypothetical protein
MGCALLALTLGGAAYAEPSRSEVDPIPVVQRQPSARPPPALAADRARYSKRQAQASGLERYRGGDGGTEIYIGIGSGAIVLIAVIVILLVVL